jgi:hypothetical protein
MRLPIALLCLAAFADCSYLGKRLSHLTASALALTSETARRYTNDSCSADCTAFDIVARYYWQKQEVTATVTAATLIYIVDDRTNTTRTSTKYNTLPDGIVPPPTNTDGTHVTTFAIATAKGESSDVVLAYPTEYTEYPLEYGWFGSLPTIDAMGKSTCSFVDPEKTTQFVDYSSYATPKQTGVGTVDSDDSKGYIYSLMGYGCYGPADTTINPNDAAPSLCQALALCGVSALSTVQFLTDTSVSHESSTPESTPAPAAKDTTTPAQQAKQTTSPAASPAGNNNNNSPTPQKTTGNNNNNNPTPQKTTGNTTPTLAPIVIGSQTVTANSQGNFVVSGQTLSQGGQVIAGGTTVSLAQGGSIAVVNGATQSLIVAPSPVLTVGGSVLTANSAGQFVVDGSTVGVGSAITVGSTTVSLTTNAAGQTVAVVNGKSSTLSAAKTGGVGDAIASGLGVQQFTGAGSRNAFSNFGAMIPFLAPLWWKIL